MVVEVGRRRQMSGWILEAEPLGLDVGRRIWGMYRVKDGSHDDSTEWDWFLNSLLRKM